MHQKWENKYIFAALNDAKSENEISTKVKKAKSKDFAFFLPGKPYINILILI